MKITEKTKQLRVFQIELSEAELREIERCLMVTNPEILPSKGEDDINYTTWDAINTFIMEKVDKPNGR